MPRWRSTGPAAHAEDVMTTHVGPPDICLDQAALRDQNVRCSGEVALNLRPADREREVERVAECVVEDCFDGPGLEPDHGNERFVVKPGYKRLRLVGDRWEEKEAPRGGATAAQIE